jgi:hypothetical protein
MAKAKVRRRDNSEVEIELSRCPQKTVDGRIHHQAPEGWWFYSVEGPPDIHRSVNYEGGIRNELVSRKTTYVYLEAVLAPVSPPPVVCSQADVARFEKKEPHYKKLLEVLQERGELRFERISARKCRVWYNNPARHEEFRRFMEHAK